MKLSADQIIEKCALILREMKLANPTNPEVFDVETKSVVFPEWIESFDNGENIDALRSPLDLYDTTIEGQPVTIGRVNAWLIEEDKVLQQIIKTDDKRGVFASNEARGKAMFTRSFRIYFFYQYGGGGAKFVRAVIERAISVFNDLPKLGFAPELAQFIEGRHLGLQCELMTEGDFKGTISYVRGCRLTIKTFEPLGGQ